MRLPAGLPGSVRDVRGLVRTSRMRRRTARLAQALGVPAAGVLVSLLAIRTAGVATWGEFVAAPVVVTLVAQVADLGSRDALLRELVREPTATRETWGRGFAARLPLVLIGPPLFLSLSNDLLEAALMSAWTGCLARQRGSSGASSKTFDVVVLDRCLQFSPDPAGLLRRARMSLDPGGLVVATGLLVFRDASVARARVTSEGAAFRERYGIDLLARPAAGVIDRGELHRLEAAGLHTHRHRELLAAALRAMLDPRRPEHRWGLAVAPAR